MLVDAKLMINGKELKTQIEIDEAVLESVQSKEKVDRGYGKQVAYSPYSYVDNVGSVKTESDRGWEIDDLRFMTANYYTSEKVAQNNARADQLMRRLRRFVVENRKDKIDWNDRKWNKFFIYYSYFNQELKLELERSDRHYGVLYFDSEEVAKQAIEEFKDELIWYFTEYKDSL